jgi:hypothetical protein
MARDFSALGTCGSYFGASTPATLGGGETEGEGEGLMASAEVVVRQRAMERKGRRRCRVVVIRLGRVN